MVITKDPDSDWVNVGTYRVSVRDKKTLSHLHRARQARRHHPQEILGARRALPDGGHGRAGAGARRRRGLDPRRERVRIRRRRRPHRPRHRGGARAASPACRSRTTAELVFEGFMPSPQELTMAEGPFGEWPGYYASSGPEPVLQVKAIYHRNDPIQCRRSRRRGRSIPAPISAPPAPRCCAPRRCGTSSRPPACRASRACGRCRAAARASST